MALLQRLVRIYRRGAFASALKRAAKHTFRRFVYSKDVILVFRQRGPVPLDSQRLNGSCALLPAQASELERIMIPYPDDFIATARIDAVRQLQKGDEVYVASIGDDVAHVSWLRTANQVVASEVGDECGIRLNAPASIIYDCRTSPEFRGRGIYPFVLKNLVNLSAQRGQDSWIYCREENQASRKGIEKAGFVYTARMTRTVWFGCMRQHRTEQIASKEHE